ncbi:Hypothetical protein A7982_01268 [Minicystis rosea]|nr:Hypothetical protein A7982_01268 [Minicystis rosea]
MNQHHKPDHDACEADLVSAHDEQTIRFSQLEPENYLLEYRLASTADPNPNPWAVLATIVVDPREESWTVNQRALTALDRIGSLRLTSGLAATSLPDVDHAFKEISDTVVTWRAAKSPAYERDAVTFAGAYIGVSGASILAIGIRSTPLRSGDAGIGVTYWYNPDAAPIDLRRSRGTVVLEATSGAYAGSCYTTSSTARFTP